MELSRFILFVWIDPSRFLYSIVTFWSTLASAGIEIAALLSGSLFLFSFDVNGVSVSTVDGKNGFSLASKADKNSRVASKVLIKIEPI